MDRQNMPIFYNQAYFKYFAAELLAGTHTHTLPTLFFSVEDFFFNSAFYAY